MKSLHMLTVLFSLTSLYAVDPAGDITRGGAIPYDIQLTLHLFDPMPQDFTQTRIFHMRERVKERVQQGESFNKAFMVETRAFILSELTRAFTIVADATGQEIDAGLYANLFLKQRLEMPFKQEKGVELFEQDPCTLDAHIFTYYVVPYLVPIFMRQGIPAQTRDVSLLLSWARTVYMALEYVEQFCKGTKQAMNALGVVNPETMSSPFSM